MSAPRPMPTVLSAFWSQRSPRERRLLMALGLCLILGALYAGILQPARRTWQEAPGRQARLDATRQQMQVWQIQARQWQGQSALPRAEAQQRLRTLSTEVFGPQHSLQITGEQAVIQVREVSGAQLAQWISQARETARARVLQAEWQASPERAGQSPRWTGQLTVSLP